MCAKPFLYIFILFAVSMFVSCKDEEKQIFKQENYTSVNAALTDLQTIYNAFAFAHYNALNTSDKCWEVERDTSGAQKKITIHFKSTLNYCQFFDSLSTSGDIILQYEGQYKSSKTPSQIIFRNYKTGGFNYEGTILSTQVDAMNYELKFKDVVAQNGDDKRLIGGYFLLNLGTDVLVLGDYMAKDSAAYEVIIGTGAASGIKIKKDITKQTYFHNGKMNFYRGNIAGTINFGDGQEDNLSTFTDGDGYRFIAEMPKY